MQEVLADGTGGLHLQPVSRRQGVHTNHLYNLLQLRLILQKTHHLLTVLHPFSIHVFVKPGRHIVQIQRVAGQPVDGRKMTLVSQRGIQSPEYLHNTKGGLGHRLRDISSRRGYGPDYREGALPLILAQGDHMAGPLVELSQTGTQICRVALLTGHLLQTAGHLTEGLSPTGGRIGHQSHGVAHIPEVLRNGNSCVNRSLPGSHRHVRGVGDQNRPLHQGFSCLGILQLRELI